MHIFPFITFVFLNNNNQYEGILMKFNEANNNLLIALLVSQSILLEKLAHYHIIIRKTCQSFPSLTFFAVNGVSHVCH